MAHIYEVTIGNNVWTTGASSASVAVSRCLKASKTRLKQGETFWLGVKLVARNADYKEWKQEHDSSAQQPGGES